MFSIAFIERVSALYFANLRIPSTSTTVTATGNPSGTAATASDNTKRNDSSNSIPLTNAKPNATITTTEITDINRVTSWSIFC